MAGRENCSEVSTELPKLLLEIVNQIDEKDNQDLSDVSVDESHNYINLHKSGIVLLIYTLFSVYYE